MYVEGVEFEIENFHQHASWCEYQTDLILHLQLKRFPQGNIFFWQLKGWNEFAENFQEANKMFNFSIRDWAFNELVGLRKVEKEI